MVKSQILCTWSVDLEPFSIFAVSFGVCLASNCVPFFFCLFSALHPAEFCILGVWFPGRSSGKFCTAKCHVNSGLQEICREVFLSLYFQVEQSLSSFKSLFKLSALLLASG